MGQQQRRRRRQTGSTSCSSAQHAASRVRRRTALRWQDLRTRREFVFGRQPLRDVRCHGGRLSLPPRTARKHLHVPDRCVPKLPFLAFPFDHPSQVCGMFCNFLFSAVTWYKPGIFTPMASSALCITYKRRRTFWRMSGLHQCRYAALLLALCPIQTAAFVPGAGNPCHRRSPVPRSNYFTFCPAVRRRAGVRMKEEGDGGAGDDLERVDLKNLAPRRLGGTSGPPSEQVDLERRVFEVTRRSALFLLSLSTVVGYVKIYGETEESLRLYDSIDAALRRATGRPLAGVTQERVRAPLDASFAQLVAEAIEHVATAELQLVDAASLHREELAIAAKAVRLFPVADPASVSKAIQGGDWSALQHSSPSTSNLALYSRLRALQGTNFHISSMHLI